MTHLMSLLLIVAVTGGVFSIAGLVAAIVEQRHKNRFLQRPLRPSHDSRDWQHEFASWWTQ